MGNVHAAGPGAPPPPPPSTGVPLTPKPPTEEKNEEEIKNPGSMEDIHKKCKGKPCF